LVPGKEEGIIEVRRISDCPRYDLCCILTTAELEMILNAHPRIGEGTVVGIPEPGCPENDIPVAYVVRLDSSLTEKDVTDFVNARVSHFKQLRRVTFVDALAKVGILRCHQW